MPGSAIVHAAVFTAGAVLGGGIATVITNKKHQKAVSAVPPTTPAPVIGLNTSTKAPQISTDLTVASSLHPVLKHGNPGMSVSDCFLFFPY